MVVMTERERRLGSSLPFRQEALRRVGRGNPVIVIIALYAGVPATPRNSRPRRSARLTPSLSAR